MLYAQYGHAPSDKAHEGLGREILDGVVLDPRTHQPDKLVKIVSEFLRISPKADILFDSNFYVCSLQAQDKKGYMDLYPFDYRSLTRMDFTPGKIQEYVQKVLDFQIENGFSKFLSPSVIFPSFDGYWAQIALQLYVQSIEYAKSIGVSDRLLLTLSVGESALREDEQLSEFLDNLTTLPDYKGYYIIVDRASENAPQWSDPSTLAGLLYMVNTLTNNDYEVVLGHTDLVGVLAKAVGANSVATGWWTNLKQFSRERYMGKRGGRPPRRTYTSGKLLNSVFIDPELQQVWY